MRSAQKAKSHHHHHHQSRKTEDPGRNGDPLADTTWHLCNSGGAVHLAGFLYKLVMRLQWFVSEAFDLV